MNVYISVAMSIDGYIDDSSSERLVLSSAEDKEDVRRLRGDFDAILVGAETVRRDNPSLRTATGDIIKVVVTRSGNLDPASRFFTTGAAEKIVIAAASAETGPLERVSTVIKAAADDIGSREIIEILERKGIKNLFVEGGTRILTMFLSENNANYLRLAVAPFFVGDGRAPRFVQGDKFPFDKNNRMTLLNIKAAGDMAVMEYGLYTNEDYRLLERTTELAKLSPKSGTAYSVGAVIVTASGKVFEGYSRETSHDNHAEEEAILKAQRAGEPLAGAVIYSSMEPCSKRSSKPVSCTELIIGNKMKKVIYAVDEPLNFVNCEGYEMLRNAGVEVLVIKELAAKAREANVHLKLG